MILWDVVKGQLEGYGQECYIMYAQMGPKLRLGLYQSMNPGMAGALQLNESRVSRALAVTMVK